MKEVVKLVDVEDVVDSIGESDVDYKIVEAYYRYGRSEEGIEILERQAARHAHNSKMFSRMDPTLCFYYQLGQLMPRPALERFMPHTATQKNQAWP